MNEHPSIRLHSPEAQEALERMLIDTGTPATEVQVFKASKMKHFESDFFWPIMFWLCMITLLVAGNIGGAYFRAEAFNRRTGQNVSTWDALWLPLRLEGSSK